MRRFLLVLAFLTSSTALLAQSPRDSVVAAVDEFFRVLKEKDSAAAGTLLRPDGLMFAIQASGDSALVRRSPNDEFIKTLAARRGTLLERMWDATVLIHKQLATLWAPYDFYRDGKFSHCGVDVFTLIRERTRWRIVNVAYTVEATGCAPSPLGPPREP